MHALIRRAGPAIGAVCIGLLIAAPGIGAADPLLSDAEALLRSGQAQAAVALLEPLEQARAGDAAYDAALGAALLQAGEPTRASVALERATTVEPGLAGARLDLGIAYYEMGAREDARRTLTAVAALAPPPEAMRVIDDYLGRIAREEHARHWSVDLALASGYDSNANSATSLNEFLGFRLTETSRATESAFYEALASTRFVQPLRRGAAFDAELDLRHRTNPEADFVDATGAEGSVGVSQQSHSSARALHLIGYRVDADGELNSDGAGLAGRYEHELPARSSVGVFAHLLAIRYADELDEKDVDQYLTGVELAHVWGAHEQASVRGALQLGRDDARTAASPYGRDLYGVDATLAWRFSGRLVGEAGASWLRSEYTAAFFPSVLADDRRDTLTQGRLDLQWQLDRPWLLEAELGYSDNRTNVDVFEYDGGVLRITARRSWR